MNISLKSVYKSKFFIIVCVLACIFNSGYALSTIYPFGLYIDIIFAYIFLLPIMEITFRDKIDMLMLSFLFLLSMIFATFILSRFSSPHIYISLVCKIIFGYGVILIYDFELIVKIFLKIMVAISVVSLIGYFLLNYTGILNTLPMVFSANGVAFGSGYIFFYIPYIPQRNCGIFWEPGVFASFLLIAIIFETQFERNKYSCLKIILFILTIITTKSTAGYGLLLFVFFYLFMLKIERKSYRKVSYFLIIIMFFILMLVFLNYSTIITKFGLSNNEVIKRLTIDQVINESRFLSIIHNLNMFAKRPLFGWGYREAYVQIKHVADISTSTFLLNVFGILGIQYTLYWIIGILKNKRNSFLINMVILMIFLMIINKESHTAFNFSWIILFYYIKNGFPKNRYDVPQF